MPAALTRRPFRLIAFDPGAGDATAIRGPIERLLRSGVLIVVSRDTDLDTVDRQLSRAIRGPHKRNLFLAIDHGSEVHGFDDAFDPVLLWKRTSGDVDWVTWMVRELAGRRGIAPEDILIIGAIAGDRSAHAGLTVVPGSQPSLAELLVAQAVLHVIELPLTPEQDPAWIMVEDGFVVAREHEIESVFAIGNGFVGSRGSLAEGSPLSSPATFVAGVYERSQGSVPHLALAPEWIRVAGYVDGSTLRLDAGEILEQTRVLDLRQGILWRHWRQRDDAGRITRIEGMRLASLADRHLLLQSITLTPENYSGTFTVEAPSLSRVVSMQTETGVSVALVAASRIEHPEGSWTLPPPTREPGAPERWKIELVFGRTYRLDRIVCVQTSREVVQPAEAARERLHSASERGFEAAVADHRAAWATRWAASDVVIDGDLDAQRAIRFALYHLISAANPEDERVSIGARALTGPAYAGHVFWDTELFMLPFFTLTYPEAARALLKYRYHTLPAARVRATKLGYRGALYAWESADTGEDVTPSAVVAPTGELMRIHVGEQEQHISADVAHAVWRYWQATADEDFLLEAGAEIVLETARFWASRASREADGRYHIRRVIGPDEYHVSVDDNAYTNGMAQWNLEIAIEAAELLRQRWPGRWNELARLLQLAPDELLAWRAIAEHMYTGFDPQTGLFEQFQGYFALEDLALAAFEPRSAPMDVVVGHERIRASQIIKQADVVMLLYLLGDRFPDRVREANFRYYEPRTGHGSSLSPPIHAAMAAQLGDVELAERYFRQTADIDLSNGMGNAAHGVHAAALGGMWQALVFGFAGLSLSDEGPRVQPRLPADWRGLRFTIQWRGHRIPIDLSRDAIATSAVAEVHP